MNRWWGILGEVGLRLDTPITADMAHLHALFTEYAADEHASVAIGGILFAAHKGDVAHRGFVRQSLDALEEERGFRKP